VELVPWSMASMYFLSLIFLFFIQPRWGWVIAFVLFPAVCTGGYSFLTPSGSFVFSVKPEGLKFD
jgi:hypothetical protein